MDEARGTVMVQFEHIVSPTYVGAAALQQLLHLCAGSQVVTDMDIRSLEAVKDCLNKLDIRNGSVALRQARCLAAPAGCC